MRLPATRRVLTTGSTRKPRWREPRSRRLMNAHKSAMVQDVTSVLYSLLNTASTCDVDKKFVFGSLRTFFFSKLTHCKE